jgi:phosphoribosylglycinamide formyltransferase 1
MQKINIAVFASTNGTDLQAIIDEIKASRLPEADLKFVLSDKEDCYALERAKDQGFKTIFIDPKGKTREEFDEECIKYLKENNIELILLIGYMRLISKDLVNEYKNKIMNIHPSLLPAFAGGMDKNVHEEILDYGAKVSGCTLHFVDEGADTGPIILQALVIIEEDETVDSLKEKVQAEEKKTFMKAIKLFANNKIKVNGRKVKIYE